MGYGGVRSGSGRKPKSERLSNYDKAIGLLNENVIEALNVLIKGLNDKDKLYRLRCSELLLKKSIPDQKAVDVTSTDGTMTPTVLEIPINEWSKKK